jgi:hypothetical protein
MRGDRLMNYIRIYESFIKDRRAKEPTLTGYTEKHHILPRSLGGGDEPENLIALTPEDHYFSHLLLAKIHGGTQWRAIHAMAHLLSKGTKGGRGRLHLRFDFGHVRRSLAEHYRECSSGPNGPMSDKKMYELRHLDGRVFLGRRFYLEARTGVPRQQISALIQGAKKTAHGWFWPVNNPRGLTGGEFTSIRMRSSEKHTLYHHDGRVWTGTLQEFTAMTGARIVWQSEKHKAIKGWYASKQDAERHEQRISKKAKSIAATRGDISGANNPRADKTIFDFYNHLTGERRKSTRFDLCKEASIPYGEMSAVLSSRQQSAKGWTLWIRRNEKFRRPASEIVLEKDGEVIRGSRSEIAAHFGLASEKISYGIYSMRVGKAKTYKGWRLVEEEAPNARAA